MHHGCYVSIATRPLMDQAEVKIPQSGLSKRLKAKTWTYKSTMRNIGCRGSSTAGRDCGDSCVEFELFHLLLGKQSLHV